MNDKCWCEKTLMVTSGTCPEHGGWVSSRMIYNRLMEAFATVERLETRAEAAQANANLYAAAPDLLEAARAMLAMYEKFMAKANHGASAYDADTIRALNDAPISARAAIAKAERAP